MYAFPLLVGIGAALGLAWSAGRARRKKLLAVLGASFWGIAGGVLGGRAAYVAVHWLYFREHWLEILQVQRGGLSWFGAALGVWLALWMYAYTGRQPFGELLDALLPMATTAAISLWLACWLEGAAYGPAASAWWALPARDEWGVIAPRVPVQLLGAGLSLGLLWWIEQAGRRKFRAGLPAALWGAGFFWIMLGLSLLRADPAPLWAGLRLDAWGALVLALASLVCLSVFVYQAGGVWEKGSSR